MIIGYDAKRFFHNFSGLGNYSRTLISNLCKFYPQNKFRLYTRTLSKNPVVSSILDQSQIETIQPTGNKLFWRSMGMVHQFKPDMDIYHGLSHELPIGISKSGIKSVVTIHDLIYHFFPHDFPWIDRKVYHFKFRYACAQADHIIAISESTKKDLVSIYNIDPKKISVVYQPVSPVYDYLPATYEIEKNKLKYQLPDRYNLFVGALTKRKNLLNVLEAYTLIPEVARTPLVVLAGGTRLLNKVNRFISAHQLKSSVLLLGQIDSWELPAFYAGAQLTIYPSLYEGFGLPIVESLAMGTPVITSQMSSMPEAGGPGALYIDPNDPQNIAEKIMELGEDPSLQNRLGMEGLKYIQKFEAQKVTKQLMDIYSQILELKK